MVVLPGFGGVGEVPAPPDLAAAARSHASFILAAVALTMGATLSKPFLTQFIVGPCPHSGTSWTIGFGAATSLGA